MLKELSRQEMEEITPGASDDERWPPLPDTRLDPAARALLGARMAAFSTLAVRRAFNELSIQFPMIPKPGSHFVARIGVEKAFEDLEKTIRHELGAS